MTTRKDPSEGVKSVRPVGKRMRILFCSKMNGDIEFTQGAVTALLSWKAPDCWLETRNEDYRRRIW